MSAPELSTLTLDRWDAASLPERPAALRARDRIAAAELGDEMDPDDYADLETRSWHLPLAREGLLIWALKDGDEIVATFETYPVVVRLRTQDGIVRRTGRILGSGFVAPEQRRFGYGRRLSGLIVKTGLTRDGLAMMYGMSETVAKVYSQTGGDSTGVMIRSWPAAPASVSDARARLIHDLSEWTEPPLVGDYDVLMTPSLLEWRLQRVVWQFPMDHDRPIGARIGDSWVIWCRAGDDDELELQHLRADAETGPALIALAQEEAAARGLTSVVAFENAQNVDWLPTGEREASDDVLMMARVPGVIPEGVWSTFELGHDL